MLPFVERQQREPPDDRLEHLRVRNTRVEELRLAGEDAFYVARVSDVDDPADEWERRAEVVAVPIPAALEKPDRIAHEGRSLKDAGHPRPWWKRHEAPPFTWHAR